MTDPAGDAERARAAGDHARAGRLYRSLGMITCAEFEEDLARCSIERPEVDPVDVIVNDRAPRAKD